jgi:hypothetical protein
MCWWLAGIRRDELVLEALVIKINTEIATSSGSALLLHGFLYDVYANLRVPVLLTLPCILPCLYVTARSWHPRT